MEKIITVIDAGGSSSTLKAYTLDGIECFTLKGGPGSPVISYQNYIENLKSLLHIVITDYPNYKSVIVVIGISGYDAIEDVKILENDLQIIMNCPVHITTDLHIALSDIITNEVNEGAIVVSGTGSAVLAIKDDKTFLVGGYGQIIRERGSSYSAVHQACLRIIDRYERNLPLTKFETAFMTYLQINKVSDFKLLFYEKGKDYIAKQVIFIKEQAQKEVKEAINILRTEGKELAKQLIRACLYLKLTKPFLVGLHGGFITINNQEVLTGFNNELNHHNIKIKLITEIDPLRGAYKLAKKRWEKKC